MFLDCVHLTGYDTVVGYYILLDKKYISQDIIFIEI